MGDDVEIRAVETLSDKHFPFRMYSFAYRRRDGARQALRREVYVIGHSAVVLPFDPRRSTVLLTRQFRLPAQVNGDAPRRGNRFRNQRTLTAVAIVEITANKTTMPAPPCAFRPPAYRTGRVGSR